MGLRGRIESWAHDALYDKLASIAIAFIALSRFIAYSALFSPPHEAPAIMVLTDGGRYLPIFAFLWLTVGLWALFDALVKDTGWSEALFLALMLVWGGGYLIAWIGMGRMMIDWLSATLYIGVALHTLFRYLENARQARRIRLQDEQGLLVATGSLPIQDANEHPEVHLHYEGGKWSQ